MRNLLIIASILAQSDPESYKYKDILYGEIGEGDEEEYDEWLDSYSREYLDQQVDAEFTKGLVEESIARFIQDPRNPEYEQMLYPFDDYILVAERRREGSGRREDYVAVYHPDYREEVTSIQMNDSISFNDGVLAVLHDFAEREKDLQS